MDGCTPGPRASKGKRVSRADTPALSPNQVRDKWAQKLAFAVVELGMSPDEFWVTYPRQMAALVKRWEHRQQSSELMLSQLTAVTANFSMCRPKKPFGPTDFMLHPPGDGPAKWKRKNRKLIAEQVRNACKILAGLHGGTNG